jgi:AraC-like DNA-binding protein
MANNTYFPTGALRPFIHSYVVSESHGAHTYKVLPETCVVIGFQYKGKLSYFDGDKEVGLSASGVTGLRDSFRVFKNSPRIGSVLIKFKDGGAASFFEQPIDELFHSSTSLDQFKSQSALAIVEEQLCEATTDHEKIAVIESFFIDQMRDAPTDKLVLNAIVRIHGRNGSLRMQELMSDLSISQSPLEKRFRKVVGTSPKKFASIVRLKHAIRIFSPTTSLTQLAYDTGFYDQAHFIKAFAKFSGQTPESFFRLK